METCKKQKNSYQLCLILLNNHVELKNNETNHKKFDIAYYEIIYGAVIKKDTSSPLPPF